MLDPPSLQTVWSRKMNLDSLKLFYGGKNSNLNLETPFGTNLLPLTNSLKFTGTQLLNEGDNYFWLLVDVSSSATINDIIDAKCTELTISTVPKTPAIGDPSGNRKIVSVLTPHTKDTWKVSYFSSQEVSGEGTNGRANLLIDGDPNTFWSSQWVGALKLVPHEIVYSEEKI